MIDLTTIQLFAALPELVTLNNENKKLKMLNTVITIGATALLVMGTIYIYNQHLNTIENDKRNN